jgi:threonine synthase
VIATNQNDILHRTFVTGDHRKEGVRPSISPSMDIQVSSNFERALFDATAATARRWRSSWPN